MTTVDGRTAGPREFVALIAFFSALTALGIDFLLPAFSPIAAHFGVTDPTDPQFLIYAYLGGFGVMQLVYGPLSDAYGRKPVLAFGIGVYMLGCTLALLAPDFSWLVAARAIQGVGAAAARVIANAIVRDRFEGREMAAVMSVTMTLFILVPIAAPAAGGLVLLVADWQAIFTIMLLLGALVILWAGLRLPETHPSERRMPLQPGRIARAAAICLSARASVGYSTAMGILYASLTAYLGSAQMIFETEVYGLGAWFPLAFALIALCMGAGSLTSARLVRRLGMRRLTKVAMAAMTVLAALLTLASVLSAGRPPLLVFAGLLAAYNLSFSLAMPNLNAMAMQPLGAVAGTASSLIGFYSTITGTLLGLAIGQAFDGTVIPFSAGLLAVCLCAGLAVFFTERGQPSGD